ncbi:hypothetical protein [Clostridium tyrobutyricum]|uniref:hypothetical protein n=1 Tax=Clostridium tyrobutyricum TaxID=1519 RepID=UPI002011BF80|nr:hypothetical protein [Clostridium tyrobutyricum]MBR9647307.1 hypothetical protein [Clostridium tyrobutyricum]
MHGFIKYLQSLGTLSDNSIKDDISRMNSMQSRGIDYTRGEGYTRKYPEDSDLSDSTVKSCLRLCRRYEEYKQIF